MFFQDLILNLQEYWKDRGCLLMQPYDVEVGAGTMNPATYLRVLGPEPWNVVYCEPSRRPTDGRYGENPNRLYQHHQMQVIMKPSPKDIQELYLDSLKVCGIDPFDHDIRFVHDDWESPTLGAWGLGWEVWCDGMEITQFTYFQQAGGFDLHPISVELTYGLERICMFLQGKDNVFDIEFGAGVTYGDVFHRQEVENSRYAFEFSNADMLFDLFQRHEAEAKRLCENDLPVPAYDNCLKCSHCFNMLDARGAISVTERAGYIGRVRVLARMCAVAWLESRRKLGFPMVKDPDQRKRLRLDEEASQELSNEAGAAKEAAAAQEVEAR